MDDDHIRDLFASLGPVTIRRMFGGKGIYREGTIFAVVLRDRLLLKGDAQCADAYEEAGGERWRYVGSRHGKEVAMPYWSAPDPALDDPDAMEPFARLAVEASLRSGK